MSHIVRATVTLEITFTFDIDSSQAILKDDDVKRRFEAEKDGFGASVADQIHARHFCQLLDEKGALLGQFRDGTSSDPRTAKSISVEFK